MTPAERAVKITKVIEEVAGAYCKRVWWADKLDLMQEAWAEVLASLARKDVPPEWLQGTVYRIASRRLAQYLWEQSAPVTGARGGKHFAGLQRARVATGHVGEGERRRLPGEKPVASLPEAPPESSPDFPSTQAEAYLGLETAREELFWRVTELYAEALERTGRQAKGLLFEAVLRVLLDGRASGDVAAELGSDLSEVYAETARVKALIVDDGTAQELLEEIADWRGDIR